MSNTIIVLILIFNLISIPGVGELVGDRVGVLIILIVYEGLVSLNVSLNTTELPTETVSVAPRMRP